MLTIKEIAEICGVSEQSIRKWCAKHEVSQVAKQWKPSETDIESMFRHYGVEVSQVAKPAKPAKPGSFAGCETNETDRNAVSRHYEKEVSQVAKPTKPGGFAGCETNETCAKPASEPGNAPKSVPWEVYEDLRRQLEVKDGQIANLSAALVSAQETAKAAQALHAAEKAEAMAIESAEAKKSRWQRLKEAWQGGEAR
jgi:hypothetical protein